MIKARIFPRILRMSKKMKYLKTVPQKYYSIKNTTQIDKKIKINEQDENFGKFFWNISYKPFDEDIQKNLSAPLNEHDIEIKPDGILYLPEIKYRRILTKAFGQGGWGLVPRGKYKLDKSFVQQEYALFCNGQFVSQSWGEQSYSEQGMGFKSLATSLEGAKSNALMRCCKDLGIASQLWDPNFILKWKEENTVKVWCENLKNGSKRVLHRRKDRAAFDYPWKEGTLKDKNIKTPITFEKKKDQVYTETPITSLDESDLSSTNMFDENLDMVEPVSDVLNDLRKDDDAASTEEPEKKFSAFKIDGIMSFGKYKGRKWKEILKEPKIDNYLDWLAKKSGSDFTKNTGKDALEYLRK